MSCSHLALCYRVDAHTLSFIILGSIGRPTLSTPVPTRTIIGSTLHSPHLTSPHFTSLHLCHLGVSLGHLPTPGRHHDLKHKSMTSLAWSCLIPATVPLDHSHTQTISASAPQRSVYQRRWLDGECTNRLLLLYVPVNTQHPAKPYNGAHTI